MSKFGVSQSVTRVEDQRFLTGTGRLESSPRSIRMMPKRPPASTAYSLLLTSKTTSSIRWISTLFRTIADTLAQAKDAAELIELDIDELPAHTETALGGEQIHAEAPNNRVFDYGFGDEEKTNAAFASAAHTASLDLIDNRVISNPMETRGCYANYDGKRLEFAYSGQGVWGVKAALSAKLQMEPEDLLVKIFDVGGGFGTKVFPYPEYILIAQVSRSLGMPVRWFAERSEGMLTDVSGRDLVTRAEAAFDADYKLQAVRIHSTANIGAHCSGFSQFIQTELATRVLTGVYDVQTAWFNVDGVFTNTTPVDAYRGAGRPEAIYVMERLMDTAARKLGQDPIEFKRKSFITKAQMPYKSVSGETYDVGDFDKVLNRALKEADIPGFAARKAASAKAGKLRGVGLSYYIEAILGQDTEITKIHFATRPSSPSSCTPRRASRLTKSASSKATAT